MRVLTSTGTRRQNLKRDCQRGVPVGESRRGCDQTTNKERFTHATTHKHRKEKKDPYVRDAMLHNRNWVRVNPKELCRLQKIRNRPPKALRHHVKNSLRNAATLGQGRAPSAQNSRFYQRRRPR